MDFFFFGIIGTNIQLNWWSLTLHGEGMLKS